MLRERCCALRHAAAVEGLENLPAGKSGSIVVNHASYIDAFVLLAVLPAGVHFAAKREFARMPLFACVLRRLGTYFVERVDPARGVEDTREIAAAVGRGETVVFFPEGTFSRAPGLAAFRLGAFAVSAETGAPVVPIVLRGTRSAAARTSLASQPLSGDGQRAANNHADRARLVGGRAAARPGQGSDAAPLRGARPYALTDRSYPGELVEEALVLATTDRSLHHRGSKAK